jgi:hypothetical protein
MGNNKSKGSSNDQHDDAKDKGKMHEFEDLNVSRLLKC